MQNSFWHKSRSLFVTGWMWHVSAVVSRILLKDEPAGTMGTLSNIQVEVSTLQTLLTLHNCKIKPRMLVQQEQIVAWNTFYAFIPWCVLLISWLLRFWRKYNSSHDHVLLNMCYNTTLIAVIGWLKPCVTGIECWIPAERSKVQRSATSLFERWLQRGKFHKFNATLQTFEDQGANYNKKM